MLRDPEDGNQYAAIGELHSLAGHVALLSGDFARALFHGQAEIGVYKTLNWRFQQAIAAVRLGLVYHGLGQTHPALYEPAIEPLQRGSGLFPSTRRSREVWRVSHLLAQSLFRSPIAVLSWL